MSLAAHMLCVSVMILQSGHPPIPDPTRIEGTPIAGCAATAAWSLLICEGRDVTLAQVTQQFRDNNAEYDGTCVSMFELRKLLISFGLETEAIQTPSASLAAITAPCILYFQPGRWWPYASTGHFVFLASTTDETATIIDWSGTTARPEMTIRRSALERRWHGQAIVVAASSKNEWRVGMMMVAVAVVGASVWSFVNRRRIHVPRCHDAGRFGITDQGF